MPEPDTNAIGTRRWRTGRRNLITDVAGLQVGHAQDEHIKTGSTVLTADKPFIASVDVMGGAPGTRETDCLSPDRLIDAVDALVLSGGSAYGLDAASGVTDALRQLNRGFVVGPVRVPIVPSAILFDLLNGGASDWRENPYRELGKAAFSAADESFTLGSVGAGTGATTAILKGGLGSASIVTPEGYTVGALVAANPHGSAVMADGPHFWAAPFEMDAEFGALGMATAYDSTVMPRNEKLAAFNALQGQQAGMNTTLAIIATDAVLNKAQLKRLAVSAQDGMARALLPSHTPFDGDLVFALSTGDKPVDDVVLEGMQLGHAAAVCLARAIARAVYHASEQPNDVLPTWRSVYGGGVPE
ncbi:MAG: P1 family peptidase [Granulosicoccus sp.]